MKDLLVLAFSSTDDIKMVQYLLFWNGKYHANIEIVKCESGRIAQKWSSAGRLCKYAGTRSFTNLEDHYSLAVVTSWSRLNNNIFFFWSAAIVKTQKLDLGLYLTKKSSEELAGNMTKLISIVAFWQKNIKKSLLNTSTYRHVDISSYFNLL